MGMESSLDQAQIWWEFMPYATRGVPAAETNTFQASVRIEGLSMLLSSITIRKAMVMTSIMRTLLLAPVIIASQTLLTLRELFLKLPTTTSLQNSIITTGMTVL